MKKTLFLSIVLVTVFSGCFSVSSINPFSSGEDKEVKTMPAKIEIPQDAPAWVHNPKEKGFISSVGVATKIDKKNLVFHKQKALLNASNKLARNIYIKTVNMYKAYEEKLENPRTYENDIKKFAEHISLKSVTRANIVDNWVDFEKGLLFIKISVDSEKVVEQIQQNSKLLFDIDKNLYHNFLSNRAAKDIVKALEK